MNDLLSLIFCCFRTDWRRRRNTTRKVSMEDGDAKKCQVFTIGNDCDNLVNRYRKLVEDFNENYEPMRRHYERLCNHNYFYNFVLFVITLMVFASTIAEDLFYNTEQKSQNMMSVILRFFYLIFLSFFFCNSIMNEIAEDKKFYNF
ncbi:hypothetical protein B9Z55_027482 [Caenorhabditis nigoni]|uniref:Uncharacterized protein n=1 Tax=Caenorhabditis nigoni TaxID=1611254 RepID=A0A2G5SG51_9PELO|nr:hypothetical protein B9Z55_027482 [Caenorhabditis nigoni]